jgi:uncharacterized protein (TIGR04255 family)
MAEPLPKYDRPPVVETVLSAQFARLPGFKTAHAGMFCQASLGKGWSGIDEQPRIEDMFERFGEDRKWGPPAFRLLTSVEAQRTQIVGSDATRMIQVQDSRFIYNWKKSEGGTYPSYAATRTEFDKLYAKFAAFISKNKLGTVKENQWEVSYINHIPKGDDALWKSYKDWKSIFPWLRSPGPPMRADNVQSNWSLSLPEDRGRLHMNLYSGKTSIEGPEALILDLTARGSASIESGFSIVDGFEMGHEIIVRSFTAMT